MHVQGDGAGSAPAEQISLQRRDPGPHEGGAGGSEARADISKADAELDFEVFKCPSDVGYEEGNDGAGADDNGIYLGMYTWYQDPVSFYDNLGNSYATDSPIFGHPGEPVTSMGPFLRPYSQIVRTSRVTLLKETKGFYASSWNTWFQPFNEPNNYVWGNHGQLRVINTGFVDGHVAPTKFEVRTDAECYEGLIRTGRFEIRGGRIEHTVVNGFDAEHVR